MTKALRGIRATLSIALAVAMVSACVASPQDKVSSAVASRTFFGLLNGQKHGSVVYSRGENYELKCDIYVPNGPGPFPAVLAVHGGAWRCGSKVNLTRHAFAFCNRGFVVVCINYRHAPRFPFPAQIQDCFAALRFMRDHAGTYQIDPDQLFGFGYSAGGHLISLLATTSEADWLDDRKLASGSVHGPTLKAVAAGGVPCDFDWMPSHSAFLSYWLGSTKSESPSLYENISPAGHVSESSPPFLLYHGADDHIVPIESAERMQESLLDHGVDCELVRLRGSGHFDAFVNFEMAERAADFFRQHTSAADPNTSGMIHSQGR